MLNKHDLNTCHFHEGHHQVSLLSWVVSLFPTNAERYWGYKYIYTPHSQFNSHLYFSTQLIIPLGQPVLQKCEMHILPNHIFIYKAGGEIIEPLETNLNLCVHLQIQDMNHIYILSSEKKSPSSKKWKHKEERVHDWHLDKISSYTALPQPWSSEVIAWQGWIQRSNPS